jgi:NAD(P)-dependent dehydrogenase (short-subunit alcohol dehydrogenase family)
MATERKRTVLVTGASSGIGSACAARFVDEGWGVYAGVREPGSGPSGTVEVELDVTSEDSIAAVAERVRGETGGTLDGLVNNAGIPGAGPVETIPPETFRAVIETNLVGQFLVTQAFLPLIRAARGRIVFISSLGGRVALAESLRAEVVRHGVEVAVVEPASMRTAIWSKGRSSLAESRERMTASQRAVYGDALAGFDEQLGKQEDSEDPSEVAEKVLAALTDRSPSERYLVGRGARTLTLLRPLVPDAIFDRISHRVVTGGS